MNEWKVWHLPNQTPCSSLQREKKLSVSPMHVRCGPCQCQALKLRVRIGTYVRKTASSYSTIYRSDTDPQWCNQAWKLTDQKKMPSVPMVPFALVAHEEASVFISKLKQPSFSSLTGTTRTRRLRPKLLQSPETPLLPTLHFQQWTARETSLWAPTCPFSTSPHHPMLSP